MELELDNYRAALEWALSRKNDAVLGGAITRSVRTVCGRMPALSPKATIGSSLRFRVLAKPTIRQLRRLSNWR